MPRKRPPARKIMDVLRLKESGFSQRQIAESLACARSTVGDTLSRAAATTLTCEEAQGLDKAALEAHDCLQYLQPCRHYRFWEGTIDVVRGQ